MHIPSATLIFSFSSDAQVVHTKSWNGEIIFIMADFFFCHFGALIFPHHVCRGEGSFINKQQNRKETFLGVVYSFTIDKVLAELNKETKNNLNFSQVKHSLYGRGCHSLPACLDESCHTQAPGWVLCCGSTCLLV